jgi:predicted  nucleic acid-binding Zn-ribbon protein
MDMSFAQALNEAKQIIVQQSNRIKADADKIRQQEKTIVDQCSLITGHEVKLKQHAGETARQAELIETLESKLAQATVAREQAEAIIDRQGQRLTTLQEQIATLEQKIAGQTEAIEQLTAERDSYRLQVPSKEDEDALASMAALLTTKKAPGGKETAARPNTMRIAEARAEAA